MFIKLASLAILFQISTAISTKCFFLPKINLEGGTYDEFESNLQACCMHCSQSQCCIGYTFNEKTKRCYLKSAINYSTEESYTTSGVKANVNGAGAKLRNIKIEGGKSEIVKLFDHNECGQFCTAYGIYSWSPPRYADEKNGECQCMSRIASIKYHFGTISAISIPNA